MKKTWVKVKRGLLQPKHREALGIRIWLFLYMLDRATWETGKITGWTDQDAADELEMPLRTVRDQRQGLEEAGYIACLQKGQKQTITIYNWVDPRRYDGEIMNKTGSDLTMTLGLEDAPEGDTFTAPQGDTKVSLGQKGDTEGDTEGDPKSVTLPCKSHNHISQEELNNAWEFTKGNLKAEMSRGEYQAYVTPIRLAATSDGKVTLFIPNTLVADWVKGRLLTTIRTNMSGMLQRPIDIEITSRIIG